jgi:hypothetical protein
MPWSSATDIGLAPLPPSAPLDLYPPDAYAVFRRSRSDGRGRALFPSSCTTPHRHVPARTYGPTRAAEPSTDPCGRWRRSHRSPRPLSNSSSNSGVASRNQPKPAASTSIQMRSSSASPKSEPSRVVTRHSTRRRAPGDYARVDPASHGQVDEPAQGRLEFIGRRHFVTCLAMFAHIDKETKPSLPRSRQRAFELVSPRLHTEALHHLLHHRVGWRKGGNVAGPW